MLLQLPPTLTRGLGPGALEQPGCGGSRGPEWPCVLPPALRPPPRPALWAPPGPQPQPQPRQGLLGEFEIQPVGQMELRAAIEGTVQLPLAGGDADVIREAGGLTQDPHAPCGDTALPEMLGAQQPGGPHPEGGNQPNAGEAEGQVPRAGPGPGHWGFQVAVGPVEEKEPHAFVPGGNPTGYNLVE